MRDFVLSDTAHMLSVTGLESIGKSSAIHDGLAQSGLKVLVVECTTGTSADFLFEFLLYSAGRTPTGIATRADFSTADLADALRTLDVKCSDTASRASKE